jgi:hydrogenase maturation protease
LTVNDQTPILVYGYGNPGRRDDGLGIAFSQAIENAGFPDCTVEQNYQLNAEEALLIADFPLVLFADASHTPEHFSLSRIKPAIEIGFTTHAMEPSSVVGLCHELYAKEPECYLLEIRGHEWAMKEGLGATAESNLKLALDAFLPLFSCENRASFLKNKLS